MYLLENPVLQRELLVNLRMPRAFVLLFLYQAILATVVYFAWPRDSAAGATGIPAEVRLQANAVEARRLVDLFFLGQYILASMMAPSFAAGSITGEKERKTYEMLLASPLRPSAIVLGKMIAAAEGPDIKATLERALQVAEDTGLADKPAKPFVK